MLKRAVFFLLLIRYNKTLLGEKLGKFPAPMLMNTIHFAMQAVLSNVIIRFSKSLQPTVIMSWRDYFMRGDCFPVYIGCLFYCDGFAFKIIAPSFLGTKMQPFVSPDSWV